MDTLRDMLTPEAARRSQPKGGCNLSKTLPKLTDDERELLNTALDDRETYTAVYLADVLKAQGYEVSAFTIRRHRNGTCTCD